MLNPKKLLTNVVDCVVFVHHTNYLVDYTKDWSGISRNGGSTCRTCTVLNCIDVARPLANGTQKRCTEINHESLRASRVFCSCSEHNGVIFALAGLNY